MKTWRDEVCAKSAPSLRQVCAKSKEWLGHIQIRSDIGAKLAAALFQKETQFFMRNEVAKAPRLALAKSILLRAPKSSRQSPGL
jgi:hypothetical protein